VFGYWFTHLSVSSLISSDVVQPCYELLRNSSVVGVVRQKKVQPCFLIGQEIPKLRSVIGLKIIYLFSAIVQDSPKVLCDY
jgi:hypothetical protein